MVGVSYATSNGTALAGTNYTATSGTLSFAANVTSKTITVPTIDDHVVTPNLTMTLALSSPSGGAVIATGTATGTIANIDTGWTATLTAGSYAYCYFSCGSTIIFGYTAPLSVGAMSSTSFNGYTITGVYNNTLQGNEYFVMSGTTAPPNSGWTSITIPGVGTLQRSAATYSTSGTTATWAWSGTAHVTSGTVTIQ